MAEQGDSYSVVSNSIQYGLLWEILQIETLETDFYISISHAYGILLYL